MGYDTDTYGTRVLLNAKRRKTVFIANSSPAPSSLPYLDGALSISWASALLGPRLREAEDII
jgi:hypothetical protein